MIKLKRLPHDPIYTNGGACKIISETQKLLDAYALNPNDYNNGTLKLDINAVYRHDNIKEKLREIQKNKCAFCEVNLDSQHGEVEHFRPKKFSKQKPIGPEIYPGYYWLSYDWNNLLLSCITCNQKWKKNLFPLKDPNKRALNHSEEIKKEKPYFINPYVENPSNFIKFFGAEAKGIDKCNRGRVTIKYFNLNRKGENGINSIYELRNDHFTNLHLLSRTLSFIPTTDPLYAEIMANIQIAKKANEQYAAMVRDNF